MPEPITIGFLAAQALAMGAEAALKAGVTETVKDAYNALKAKIAKWAGADVAALEKTPTSASRQAVIAETIDVQPEQERETLQVLVEALVDRLKQSAPAIGLDIGRLTEMDTHLGKITVGEGIGARIGEARGGRLDVDEIIVGSPPRK